jgi:hypothetical protein
VGVKNPDSRQDASKNASPEVSRSITAGPNAAMRTAGHLRPWVGMDLPERVARPEGTERTPPTIVIEGLDEIVQALLAA